MTMQKTGGWVDQARLGPVVASLALVLCTAEHVYGGPGAAQASSVSTLEQAAREAWSCSSGHGSEGFIASNGLQETFFGWNEPGSRAKRWVETGREAKRLILMAVDRVNWAREKRSCSAWKRAAEAWRKADEQCHSTLTAGQDYLQQLRESEGSHVEYDEVKLRVEWAGPGEIRSIDQTKAAVARAASLACQRVSPRTESGPREDRTTAR